MTHFIMQVAALIHHHFESVIYVTESACHGAYAAAVAVVIFHAIGESR